MAMRRFLTVVGVVVLGWAGCVPARAQADDLVSRYMTSVQAELAGRVDAKNAVIGQEVRAVTRALARLADGTELVKGTKLIGHVMQVRARREEQGSSLLSILFDQAVGASGRPFPVRVAIRMVAPSGSMAAMNNAGAGQGRNDGQGAMSDAMPDATTGATTSAVQGEGQGGRRSSTGGVTGMGGNGRSNGAGGGYPGQVGMGGGPISAGGVGALGSRADVTPAVNPVASARAAAAGETVSTAARPTGLVGVLLAVSTTATTSGTLISYGKNVSLESGTQLMLGVITR